MSDLNWCTCCDTAINHYSDSLYCSEDCLRGDALKNHPLLGYEWNDFVDFPRPYYQRNPAFSAPNAYHAQPEQQHDKAINTTAITRATAPDSMRSKTTTSRRSSSAIFPSLSPSLLSSSSTSLCASPALTANSTTPSSPASSSFYSSALPPSKFDMLLSTNDTKNTNNKHSNKHSTMTKSVKSQGSLLSARMIMPDNHPS
ncbi:hypothetical protein BDB00DRAFT_803886 [Zychaea mexicana]|uniref:uncharacterized protein n=1 Tax=Zychaea mexicana TaxID=64656 RepID=UPI0022FDCAAF|nr:uncharacterized protein BDB00DRAFT_803886 [Zychaea mexicana]KAI9497748.1 hypothetical protein BDB00DRAFT_803886 [Zychaea mexicana]